MSTPPGIMDGDDLHEVLITNDSCGKQDEMKDDKPAPSLITRPRVLASGPYGRLHDEREVEEGPKVNHADDGQGQYLKSIHGGTVVNESGSDHCNNLSLVSGRIQDPRAPSTVEDGMPAMYPRDADVLPTAVLMTCCCPLCGCISILYAKKARRLRQAGKFHASALATEASTWWAWSAALSGCFILLGLALSTMIFLLMMYA